MEQPREAAVASLTLAQQRVLIALEAYRQVALPGSPGPAALSRVASVRAETANRALVMLRADGLLPEGMQ